MKVPFQKLFRALTGVVFLLTQNVIAQQQQPIRDSVYLQETGRKITTPQALTSLAVFENKLYAASSAGIAVLEGNQLIPLPDLDVSISRLVTTTDAIWAIGNPGLYRGQNKEWQRISGEQISDVTEHNGKTIISKGRKLATIDSNSTTQDQFFS